MTKRIRKKATHARCRWCGKVIKFTKDRLANHKADRDWEYRDDDRCPGSGVLRKFFPQHAVETHPQALSKKRKRSKVRG